MNTKTKELAYIALMTAVISVLAPISLPIVGEVPISLATLAVMLAGVLLGSRNGAAAAALYLVLGAIGVPVFAGFSSKLMFAQVRHAALGCLATIGRSS